MAALQGMLPIGIVIGYSIAILLGKWWYSSFILQSSFILVLMVVFLFIPSRIDIDNKKLNINSLTEPIISENKIRKSINANTYNTLNKSSV